MIRMGHHTARAALIHQHTTSDGDRALVDRRGEMVEKELRKAPGRFWHGRGTGRLAAHNGEGPGQGVHPPGLGLFHFPYCAPGRIRTCDTSFRRAVLYPLSY